MIHELTLALLFDDTSYLKDYNEYYYAFDNDSYTMLVLKKPH